jgi:hypothetical protein
MTSIEYRCLHTLHNLGMSKDRTEVATKTTNNKNMTASLIGTDTDTKVPSKLGKVGTVLR